MKFYNILIIIGLFILAMSIIANADTTISGESIVTDGNITGAYIYGNFTGNGTFTALTTVGDELICLADGTNCIATGDTNDTAWIGNVTENDCPSGYYAIGIQVNGTFFCSNAWGNPFDQVLNTTSAVTFDNVTVRDNITTGNLTVIDTLNVKRKLNATLIYGQNISLETGNHISSPDGLRGGVNRWFFCPIGFCYDNFPTLPSGFVFNTTTFPAAIQFWILGINTIEIQQTGDVYFPGGNINISSKTFHHDDVVLFGNDLVNVSFGNFDKINSTDVNIINANFTGNVNVTNAVIYGQVISFLQSGATTCNTACSNQQNLPVTGYTWACYNSTLLTGVQQTTACSDTTSVNKNCFCKSV